MTSHSFYDALVFDLDGTAIESALAATPSDLLKHTVATTSSLTLFAATGRSVLAALPVLQALELKTPCAISGGAQVIDPQSGNILWQSTIHRSTIQQLFAICQNVPYEIIYAHELGGEKVKASDKPLVDETPSIYILKVPLDEAPDIVASISTIESLKAIIVPSWTPACSDIHITNIDATKERAVTEILAMIEISKEKTIGIGDSANDIELFKAVGHKIAMGNAIDDLKELADEIAGSLENDGLVQVIKKYAA